MKNLETGIVLNLALTVCLVLACALFGTGCAMKGDAAFATWESPSDAPPCLKDKAALSCRGGRLSAANLSGITLAGGDFSSADMRYSVLTGIDGKNANFENANLVRSNLMKADLTGANLQYADLSFADLRGADLRHAKLTGANLGGADLRGALLDEHAALDNVNLNRAVMPDGYRFAYPDPVGMNPQSASL